MNEILCSLPLLPDEAFRDRELDSVHLREVPGAFRASLNHYLKSHHVPCHWTWIAHTLNPEHEAHDTLLIIMDDDLIANTFPWWYFTPDNTGDWGRLIERRLLVQCEMYDDVDHC